MKAGAAPLTQEYIFEMIFMKFVYLSSADRRTTLDRCKPRGLTANACISMGQRSWRTLICLRRRDKLVISWKHLEELPITAQRRLSGNSPPKTEAFAAAFGGSFPSVPSTILFYPGRGPSLSACPNSAGRSWQYDSYICEPRRMKHATTHF